MDMSAAYWERERTHMTDFNFDPFAPGQHDQRPAVFAELREQAPIWHTDSDLWVVSRFEDVKAVNASPDLFSSRPNPYEGDSADAHEEMSPEILDRILVIAQDMSVDLGELAASRAIAGADPPEHTRMRRIVRRGFTPPRIAEMAAAVDEIVDGCIDGITERAPFDVVERLAIPLPVEMICHILGIDPEYYGGVKRWSDAFASAAVGDQARSPEGQLTMLSTLKEFSDFFVPLVESRRENPQSDLISTMIRAIDDDSLTTIETMTMAITIMVAGNETSTNLIGNTVVELLSNPEQLGLLTKDPSLLPNAIEESNRLTAPIQFTFREAKQDTEIGGTKIPKGSIVVLHLAAANRDPRQFDDPDDFRIDRPLGKNLSFGHGIHFCLGAHLAGLEVRTAIGKLLPYLESSYLKDDLLQPNPSVLLNGWRKVELTWS
jgi:cytochrome P450